MSDLDRDAIKARAERVARMLVRAGGGAADLLNLVLDDTPALLAALEEAERAKSDLFDEAIRQKRRANDAERRIAAVEAEALVWEMSPRQMAPTRGVGQIIRAALHPVAETTERME